MVPSCAGGSSTPFLGAPWIRADCGGPQGLFLVLFSVRCAAVHLRQQDSHTGISPGEPQSKSPDRVRTELRTGIHHQNTGARKKNPKKSRIHGNPPRTPRVLLHVRPGASGAPGRTPSSPDTLLDERTCGRSSPRRAKHRRGRVPRRRAPGARILLFFHLTHTGGAGLPAHQQAHSPRSPAGHGAGPGGARSAAPAARPGPDRHEADRGRSRTSEHLRARSGAAWGGLRPCR